MNFLHWNSLERHSSVPVSSPSGDIRKHRFRDNAKVLPDLHFQVSLVSLASFQPQCCYVTDWTTSRQFSHEDSAKLPAEWVQKPYWEFEKPMNALINSKGCATTYPSFLSRQVWWNCFLKWSNKSNVWFSFHFQPLRHCCSCTKVFIISRGRHWPDLGAFPMEVSFPVEESHTLVLTESWLLIVVPELRSGFNFPRPSSKEESPSSLLSSRSDDCAHISTLTLSKS